MMTGYTVYMMRGEEEIELLVWMKHYRDWDSMIEYEIIDDAGIENLVFTEEEEDVIFQKAVEESWRMK
jgi:aspartyl-tRNA synthetase